MADLPRPISLTTGIALAVGSILLAWWLVTVAAGGELFAATHAFIASPIGMLLLFGAEAFGATGLMIDKPDDIAAVMKKAFDVQGR